MREAQDAAGAGPMPTHSPREGPDFDPYDGYLEFVKRSLDLEKLKARDMRVLVEPMWGAGAGWIPRMLAGGKIRVTEIHQNATRGLAASIRNPSGPTSTRRWASSPPAAMTSACSSTATPTAPARQTRRAPSSTSSR